VTLAGAVVVGVAETLGGWLAGWALNEEVSLGLSPCSSVLDMRTTRVLFSAPEAVLIDAGQFQVFERLFGVRGQMLADYTDAKTPGMQAMHDKLMKTLAFEWLTCGEVNVHYGKLDAGKAFSPAQMLIDFEINHELAALGSGIPVTDDTLAVDLIRQVALEHKRSFLESEHTLRHFRESLWRPRLMDRTSWEGGDPERQKERQALEAAEGRWRGALAAYRPPEIPADKLRAVDQVMRRAREALL
jgi:trimethylamine--corrinoid protein Co-methyltransferase